MESGMLVKEVNFNEALLELRSEDGWEFHKGSWRIVPDALDNRAMTRFMLDHQARLMTISSLECEGGETRLFFHWDLEGKVLTFATKTENNTTASIADLCPGADWIEREIHEYFAVEFSGRDNTKPLMLRPGLEPGLNRRQGAGA